MDKPWTVVRVLRPLRSVVGVLVGSDKAEMVVVVMVCDAWRTYVGYEYERNSWAGFHQRRRRKDLNRVSMLESSRDAEHRRWIHPKKAVFLPLTLRFSIDINCFVSRVELFVTSRSEINS